MESLKKSKTITGLNKAKESKDASTKAGEVLSIVNRIIVVKMSRCRFCNEGFEKKKRENSFYVDKIIVVSVKMTRCLYYPVTRYLF